MFHLYNMKEMKEFLNISLLTLVAVASLSLASCKNEVDQIFDEDAVTRLAKAQAEYVDILTSQGGRWQMQYFSNDNEPGYVYVMTFDKNGSVAISGMNKWIGIVDGVSSVGSKVAFGSATSMWDVIADNGPVLSFNTYNKYFHLFADPYDIPSENQGGSDFSGDTDTDESGYGHEGDYEFTIMKYSGDTLYLTGKKYNLDIIMVRINDAGYPGDEMYMNEVTAMADSFFNAKIPQAYINLPNGVRWIVKNGASGILKMFREGADEISTAETHNVIITHDGLSFMNPLTLDGYVIQNFILQADGSLLCRDDHETTMTADPLSMIFSNTGYTWRLDANQLGGNFAQLYSQIDTELRAYQTRILQYVQINYDTELNCFSIRFNVKKGTSRFNPTWYFTIEPVGDNQMKITVAAEGDKTAQNYAERCPSLRSFVDALSGTLDLSANSLLSPTCMRLTNGSGNYSTWVLQ